eukprot:COSAG05_NODE_108_length_18693_cov_7.956709_2_plen_192_part_00
MASCCRVALSLCGAHARSCLAALFLSNSEGTAYAATTARLGGGAKLESLQRKYSKPSSTAEQSSSAASAGGSDDGDHGQGFFSKLCSAPVSSSPTAAAAAAAASNDYLMEDDARWEGQEGRGIEVALAALSSAAPNWRELEQEAAAGRSARDHTPELDKALSLNGGARGVGVGGCCDDGGGGDDEEEDEDL